MLHQINSLHEVLKLKQNFRKNKVVTGKTPFFVIGPFCTPDSICLINGFFSQGSLYGNGAFSILVFSTKKRYSNFLKKVFVFQKICFNVNGLKTFKISTDCLIKTCSSLRRRGTLKISIIVF